jgi:cellulose synthase (UDP-forming)
MLSFAILGIMLIGMTRPDNSTFRVIPLVIAGIITLGYGFWRTAETLPDMTEPLNLTCELANGAGLAPLPLNIHADKA